MKLLAAIITWLAIMTVGGIVLWLAMTGIGLTGLAMSLVAIGWGIPVGCIATIAAIAAYDTTT